MTIPCIIIFSTFGIFLLRKLLVLLKFDTWKQSLIIELHKWQENPRSLPISDAKEEEVNRALNARKLAAWKEEVFCSGYIEP